MLIVEPQCTGFIHSSFNAAFLAVISKIFPTENLFFMAEEKHIGHVKSLLLNSGSNLENIEFKNADIKVLDLPDSDFSRMPFEKKFYETVFEFMKGKNIDKIIFSSSTAPGIHLTKKLLKKYPNIKCYGILHGIAHTLQFEALKLKTFINNKFPQVFLFGNTDRYKFIVLGESIKQEVLKRFPHMKKYLYSVDHPYFFESDKQFIPFQYEKIRFGVFGSLDKSKGYKVIKKIIDKLKCTEFANKFEIVVIGSMSIEQRYNQYIRPASQNGFISREEFDILSETIDYSLLLYDSKAYKFKASGSFFDTLSYLKPTLALKSSFIQYYFNKLGNIGYLCNNYKELEQTMLEILKYPDIEKYNIQRQSLLEGRELLNLEKIGNDLYSILCES